MKKQTSAFTKAVFAVVIIFSSLWTACKKDKQPAVVQAIVAPIRPQHVLGPDQSISQKTETS